jgi:hypothetical protein
MWALFLQFLPFFALVALGWAGTRGGLVPLAGIPALNVLGLIRTTGAQQKAQHLRRDAHTHAHQDEEDDGQVFFDVHHADRPCQD